MLWLKCATQCWLIELQLLNFCEVALVGAFQVTVHAKLLSLSESADKQT